MPSGPFAHICFLVKNLDAAIEKWTTILGVLDPGQLERKIVRYDDFTGGDDRMRWATFVSDHGAEIQLMEPGPATPLYKRLEKLGDHCHHVCFTTEDVEGSLAALRDKGIQTVGDVSRDDTMPWQEWGWVSHKDANGLLIEVAKPYRTKDDGKWYAASS